MLALIVVYGVYLVFYAVISYAILFHLRRFRVEGDASRVVSIAYVVISLLIIAGSFLLLKPIPNL